MQEVCKDKNCTWDCLIFGMPRSGSTLLTDLLSVKEFSLVINEPCMNEKTFSILNNHDIVIDKDHWKKNSHLEFVSYFNSYIRPDLHNITYFGAKHVLFNDWKKQISLYKPRHIILIVRDIRDIVLSFIEFDTHRKKKIFSEEDIKSIAMRVVFASRQIMYIAKKYDATIIKYEDLCDKNIQKNVIKSLLTKIKFTHNVNFADIPRNSIRTNSNRQYEIKRHKNVISPISIHRYKNESNVKHLQIATSVYKLCKAYNSYFNYQE